MSNVKRYVSVPTEVEAIQFTGDNAPEIADFALEVYGVLVLDDDTKEITIPTLEGKIKAKPSDFIVKGTEGEIYPCKEVVFRKKYKEVSVPVKEKQQNPPEILNYFTYEHLPERLKPISKAFSDISYIVSAYLWRKDHISKDMKKNILRLLLEAKDCAVRAYISNPKEQEGGEDEISHFCLEQNIGTKNREEVVKEVFRLTSFLEKHAEICDERNAATQKMLTVAGLLLL